MPSRVKIQIVPLGDWKGHSAGEQHYGEAEALAMVERANRLVSESGNPLQIDYEHASLDPPATGAPAAGWMHAFTLENDGIWADVEWTAKARDMIKAGEYKYISPVICSGGADPVTGESVPIELFNAALTNQPFMHDKIKQVVASAVKAAGFANYFTNSRQITTNSQGGPTMAPDEIVPAMAQAVGLPATASVEELESLLKAVKQMLAVMPGAPAQGMPTPEQMGEMETEMKQQMMNSKTLTEVATLLSVTPDKVLPTVAAMSNKTTDTDTLKTELATVKANLLARDAADLITANSAKIPPAKRDFWLNHAKTHGVEATASVLAELPDVLPASVETPKTETTHDNSKPSPEFIKFRKDKGRTDEQIKVEWANLKKEA